MDRAKLFSLLLTAFCTLLVGLEEGVLVAAGVPIVFGGALAFIWFGDFLGEYVGSVGPQDPRISRATPGWMMRGIGWIMLLVMSGRVIWECFRYNPGK